MAAFEIAVGEYEQSSKSDYFYKKLRIARIELAKAITEYGYDQRIDEHKELGNAFPYDPGLAEWSGNRVKELQSQHAKDV